jgi:2-polyprenyl-3-methyl-5-hydroxy-6-metoxy-1,4-benzoquinol methylase
MSNLHEKAFYYPGALHINSKRLEFIGKLNLNLSNKKILETGCGGKGDITSYLLQHTNNIILSDAREDNIDYLKLNLHRTLYKLNENKMSTGQNLEKYVWDMNEDLPSKISVDIIFCFGTLYHLNNPDKALFNLSNICKEYCVISTATNGSDKDNDINFIPEFQEKAQSYTLTGCRPSRKWVFNKLKKYFKYVYAFKKQPNHPDFKKEWPTVETCRFMIIGSHIELKNENLTTNLPNIYL